MLGLVGASTTASITCGLFIVSNKRLISFCNVSDSVSDSSSPRNSIRANQARVLIHSFSSILRIILASCGRLRRSKYCDKNSLASFLP